MWWRRVVAAVSAMALALGLGVVTLVIAVNLRHPRDEAGYVSYLGMYGSPTGEAVLTGLPDTSALVSAGDDACAWLGGREFALWRTSPDHRFPATMAAYLHTAHPPPLPWTGPPDRSNVAAGAWTYLCPATRELHKPHYVFSSPPGD